MAGHKLINNFTGGEVTPYFDGRIDQAKYDTSCQTMENFSSLPWGGASFRFGTKFVDEITGAQRVRLIPFTSTNGNQFNLVVNNVGGVTFYFVNANQLYPVMYLGVPFSISLPVPGADVDDYVFKQINDVLLLCHKDCQVLYTKYKGGTSGQIFDEFQEYLGIWRPYDDENVDSAFTISSSATTGSPVNLVATKDVFDATDIAGTYISGKAKAGTYFYMRHVSPVGSIQLALTGTATSSSIVVSGGWRMITSQNWYGTLLIERSIDGGTTWETIRTSKSSSDHNTDVSGDESNTNVNGNVLLRLNYTYAGNPFAAPVWTGAAPAYYATPYATLELTESYITGIVEILTVADSKHATAKVIKDLASTSATPYWSVSSFREISGFPKTIGLYEQRLFLGSTQSKATTVWGSVSGDFNNFRAGSNADDSVTYQIADTEYSAISWLAPMIRLHAGTANSEHIISSGTADDPLSPSNISIKRQSSYGCAVIQPVLVDNSILFVERNYKRIREMREMSIYANPSEFMCPDLTILAEHMFKSKIVDMAYGKFPDPVVYVVNGDGELLKLTYNKEQNIVSWARFVTDGLFESVCCIKGTEGKDLLVTTVKRTRKTLPDQRSLETFYDDTVEILSGVTTSVHLDCCLEIGGGIFTPTVAVPHLAYNYVTAVFQKQSNGATSVFYNQYVDAGLFTCPADLIGIAGVWIIGMPYTGTLKPMKPDMMLQNGASLGRKRRVNTAIIRFKESLGCKYGEDLTRMDELPFRDTSDPMDAAPPLFTGDKVVNWPGQNNRSGDVIIQQVQPFPCTILAINSELTVTED